MSPSKTPHKVGCIQVNVKLAPGKNRGQDERRLAEIPGILSVTRTFPDELEEELANMYVVEVDESKLAPTMTFLRNNAKVQFVEAAAPRKLIR